METDDPPTIVRKLKDSLQASACAFISRDGMVRFAEVPIGAYPETFGIMEATILGAATTVNTELNRAPPDQVIIEGRDSRTLIVRSGRKAFLVAVVDREADVQHNLQELSRTAELLRSD